MDIRRLLIAGLLCRCPYCGRGPLFEGFLTVKGRCAACGGDLSLADSGDGPVVFIVLVVGAVGCAGLLYSELALHAAVWMALVVWIPVSAALALAALRPFKGVLLALQIGLGAAEGRGEGHDGP
jgi:uncharacterized protein (DUF983 family)